MKADRRAKECVLTALGFELLAVVLATVAAGGDPRNQPQIRFTITSAAGLVFVGAAGARLEAINRD